MKGMLMIKEGKNIQYLDNQIAWTPFPRAGGRAGDRGRITGRISSGVK
jgi:hypothetical protein